jgi:hypothetical protein
VVSRARDQARSTLTASRRGRRTLQPELDRIRLWMKLDSGERLLDLSVNNRIPQLEGLEIDGKAKRDPEVVQRLLDALAAMVEEVAGVPA